MRADQGSIFAGTIMEENSQTRLRHILERSEPPEQIDANNFKKLKAGYDACLNESAIRKRGTKPLADLLGELQNVYPASNELVSGAKDHLTKAILFLMQSGVDALVSSGVSVSLPFHAHGPGLVYLQHWLMYLA